MGGGSGGGGGAKRGGGGSGDAGQPGEVVREANKARDNELKSAIKTLDAELDKTHAAIKRAGNARQFAQADFLRDLRESLQSRKEGILNEAKTRNGLKDQIKYERGRAVGFK